MAGLTLDTGALIALERRRHRMRKVIALPSLRRSMTSIASLRGAVHALDLEEEAWVDAIFAEARRMFDDGLGTFVYTYRIGRDPVIGLGAASGRETAPAVWRALGAWGQQNAASLVRLYGTGVSTLEGTRRVAARRGVSLGPPGLEAHGVCDLLVVSAHDEQGVGAFITLPRGHRVAQHQSNQRVELERLSRDLSAMVRLREHRRRMHVARLSASEQLVARRLLEGASDKEIAGELRVSLSTVSTFVQRARSKLGCEPGAELLGLSSDSRTTLARRLDLFARLTAAECDVASALLVGSSYAAIAARRRVSERTIASQCATIFRKCRVSGRRALAAALLGSTSGK